MDFLVGLLYLGTIGAWRVFMPAHRSRQGVEVSTGGRLRSRGRVGIEKP